jgi:hypothetical protein
LDSFLERALIARQIHRVAEETTTLPHERKQADRLWKAGHPGLAAAVRAAAEERAAVSRDLLGREKATAARKRFMKGWTDKFIELCGHPLDELRAF